MSGILTPGYLRWDGTKYVLDHDVEITGPPGSAGPTGPVGPAGPPGPYGTASGDITGTYPGPMAVVGLTGILGIVNFGGSITNPTISQTSIGATSGQPLTFKAQDGTANGGNVVLQSGTGTSAGLIQFVTGSNTAAYFDSNRTFRIGPNATATLSGPYGINPIAGTDYIYGNNAAGSMIQYMLSGASNQRSAVSIYNYAAGGSGINGVSIMAPGSTYGVGSYAQQGVIEQTGPSTSALIFSKILGDGTSRTVTGRIFQTGAWTVGDLGTGSSSYTQAGLTGPLLSFSNVTGGSLTSTGGQALIFKTYSGGPDQGTLYLQAQTAVNQMSGTTSVTRAAATKFITLLGRTLKLVTTTTSPYTVLATDEIISIGTISTQATTIAAGSNGVSLPTGTINVASTTGFPTSGFILVVTTNGPQVVKYTGVSGGTQFTGCTLGTGTMSTGGAVTSLFTVTLPASPSTGDRYTVKDANGSAGSNNIVVDGNGKNIDSSGTLLIMTNYTNAMLTYNGTTWISSLTNNVSPNAGYTSVVNVVSGGSANVVGFDQLLVCDPTSGTCTVTVPPSPSVNFRFTVKDATFKANVNAIIVDGNGRTLENPVSLGTYTSPINITTAGLSATWAFDPTRNRYTLVSKVV